MWFGTRGGLNRYDGYTFKQFKPQEIGQGGLSGASIETLRADGEGNILIGTKSGGFCKYNSHTEQFEPRRNDGHQPKRLIALHEDREGNRWFGGWYSGLWCQMQGTDSLVQLMDNEKVSSIVQTTDGTIWCGTGLGLIKAVDGNITQPLALEGDLTEIIVDEQEPFLWLVGWETHLIRYNYLDNTYQQFKSSDPSFTLKDAYSLEQLDDGNILVGTWGQGLFLFDKEMQQFHKINIAPDRGLGARLDYDVILDIFEDDKDNIWLGTDGGGIVHLYKKSNFNVLHIETANNVLKCHINAVYSDDSSRLWLGTKGNGLFISTNNKVFRPVGFAEDDATIAAQSLVIKAIVGDEQGRIWVSADEGLFVVEESRQGQPQLSPAANRFSSPDLEMAEKVQSLYFDGNNLWLGTQQWGLYHFQKQQEIYQLKQHFSRRNEDAYLPENRITDIFKWKEALWIATYNGLFKYDSNRGTFSSLNTMLIADKGLLCDIVLCTHIDDHDQLWLGTPCGLNRLTQVHADSCALRYYGKADGFIDDYINSILEDEQGRIWISTNGGLSALDTVKGQVLNFDNADGVGVSNFSEAACFKAKDNTLFFGSSEGVTSFVPADIGINRARPKPVFTAFKVLNKEVSVADDGLINVSLNAIKRLELTHVEREVSFQFAALDFKAPHKIQYAYQMEGADDEWKIIGPRRFLSFSNLKPGDYTLRLKATNSNGVWSDQISSLPIVVHPPLWKTWYALLLYLIIIILVVMLIMKFQLQMERLNNTIRLEKINAEKEHQLTEYKLNFFTNISHELRTPLTLITAPLAELMARDLKTTPVNYISNKLGLISKNTRQLQRLINQLMEFRKIDTGKIKLCVSSFDVVPFVNDVLAKFRGMTEVSAQVLKIDIKVGMQEVYADQERLELILDNLLSNAFKYSGKPGKVGFHLEVKGESLVMSVTNDGEGLSKTEMSHVFERFYQGGTMRLGVGSGVGLALVKSYVDLHHGSIEVDSQRNEWTRFTLTLPLGNTHFATDEVKLSEEVSTRQQPVHEAVAQTAVDLPSLKYKSEGHTIVIVEDNEAVRNYLLELLSQYYQVFVAADGMEGFNCVVEHQPALVISDVMMPCMDGYELCARIKKDERLMHIPVLLLTAKGLPEDELYGARTGADAYLTKPFSPELLLEKARQLIALRQQLSDKYAKQVRLEASQIDLSNTDAVFIEKALKAVEQNMDNPTFDSEQLAVILAMSSSTFYRRIKKVTGQTPRDFIMGIKMKKAAQYLLETNFTVTEIVEKLGYQEVKTFRRHFKEAHGLTPSEYRKK